MDIIPIIKRVLSSEHGLQLRVAQQAGVSETTVSLVKSGARRASPALAKALADLLVERGLIRPKERTQVQLALRNYPLGARNSAAAACCLSHTP